MPRKPRIISRSGYMHVIVRGIGKQILFEERADFVFFMKALKRFSKETDVTVIAYCLMENHVHLLVYDMNHCISQMMRKIGVCYSRYFNRKYERTGHLFQDRYLSEPVDNEAYFRIVFRYILLNPQKAGICPAFEYEWSSIREFGDQNAFTDTSVIEELLGDYEQYVEFIDMENEDVCMEYKAPVKDDEWAKSVIQMYLGPLSGTAIQQYGRQERNTILRQLKEAGLSIKQLERLTGLGRGVIQRA